MMQKMLKIFILPCTVVMLSWHPSAAQNKAEALFSYLTAIQKADDTAQYNRAINWLENRNDSAELLYHPDITSEFKRLQNLLSDYDYYYLLGNFFVSNFAINTDTAKFAAIRFTRDFVEAHNQPKSAAEKLALLTVLREARIPFRNSDRIYDGIQYYSELIAPAKSKADSARLTIIYYVLGGFYNRLGLSEKAEYAFLKSIEYLDNSQPSAETNKWIPAAFGLSAKVNRYAILGTNLLESGRVTEGEQYLSLAAQYYQMADQPSLIKDGPYVFLHLAEARCRLNPDSSDNYFQDALFNMQRSGAEAIDMAFFFQRKAANFITRGMIDSAMICIEQSKSIKASNQLETVSYYGELTPAYYEALVIKDRNNPAAMLNLLIPEIAELKNTNARPMLQKEMQLLANAYNQLGDHKREAAVLYGLIDLRESIANEADSARAINYGIEKQMEAASIKMAVIEAQAQSNKEASYYLLGIVGLLALSAITLVLAFLNKRKTNHELQLKNNELSKTLEKLRATQVQLIHAEKMASLGELTAGIAHEIQNPLNFVNNFSEINDELMSELVDEVDKGNTAEVKVIAADIKQNLEKINHHGRRADAIVKGMLEHSRKSEGEKSTTDLNILADEYLRLAFHGMRAKDKSFDVKLVTEFDPQLPTINVVQADISRVLLNLINNAFYAAHEKANQNISGYEPMVKIKTSAIPSSAGGGACISVEDNGNGIPDAIKEKIFQPFFTTKPTGQGTGLGLSLSYDIVKAHGGEISVKSIIGKGTEMIISLPIQNEVI